MVKAALVLAALILAGCFEDRYQCRTDADCDVGTAGRCEADHFCSTYDLTCDTHYRYATHAEELTNVCYDDSAALPNACAGGQGPARAEGCFANVCARLPACCEVGWFDACVPIAQEECDLSCDTRVAVTAIKGMTTELWDLRWNGAQWTAALDTELSGTLAWVAPAPGTVEPRLAGTTASSIVVGDATFPIAMGRSYTSIASVSLDRHGADTVAAGYTSAGANGVDLLDIGDGSVRSGTPLPGGRLVWGDVNRDGFPDAVGNAVNNLYAFIEAFEDAPNEHRLLSQTSSNLTGGATTGAAPLRSMDMLDFNGDHRLDLAVMGMSVRIHMTAEGLRDSPDFDLDCSPPSTAKPCDGMAEPDLEAWAFVGGAYPTRDTASVIIAQYPDRKLWRAHLDAGALKIDALPFPGDTCRCIEQCDNTKCPGANCTCMYDCASCAPVLAIASRDLDGDHALDLIAIDAKMRIYTALAAQNLLWSAPMQIPTQSVGIFSAINISVSGAPR